MCVGILGNSPKTGQSKREIPVPHGTCSPRPTDRPPPIPFEVVLSPEGRRAKTIRFTFKVLIHLLCTPLSSSSQIPCSMGQRRRRRSRKETCSAVCVARAPHVHRIRRAATTALIPFVAQNILFAYNNIDYFSHQVAGRNI